MRKFTFIFALVFAALTAGAQNNWHFRSLGNGTCKVIPYEYDHNHYWYTDEDGHDHYTSVHASCHCYRGDADIPSTDGDGNTVVAIESGCFYLCDITSVNIPGTVNAIESDAFRECKRLPKVVVPEGVTTIGDRAFLECDALTSVSLPSSLLQIGGDAFRGLKAVKEFTIPANVENIGNGAFMGMESLEKITIADGSEMLTIGVGREYGGEGMFGYNNQPALKEAYIGRDWTVTSSHGLFEGHDSYQISTHLKKLTIGNLVTAIPAASFLYCYGLEQVSIGSGVKYIYDFAFYGDNALRVISVEAIEPPTCDTYTFTHVDKENCILCVPAESLDAYREAPIWKDFLNIHPINEQATDGMFCYIYNHVERTATLTYSRNSTDSNKKGGTYVGDVVIPAKAPNGYDVTVIGEDAFYNCPEMTSLTIPATIDSIGCEPFAESGAHLTKITIEDGDTPLRCHVRDAWPMGCYPVFGRDVRVEEIYIGRNYHSFVSRGWVEAVYEGSWSLIRDSEYLKTVTMGDVFTEVPYAMFYGCTQLQTVNVSPNVKSVGKEAFWNCESLTDINLPDGVEVIDEEAFGHCKLLEPFDLPSSLKLIGARAFLDCDMFSSFTIPASVDSLGVSILDDCDNLKRIDIAYGPTPLKMSCSNQFNNSLRSAPIDTLWTDRYIDGAFSDNRTLKKLYIGSNVEALHDYLFSDCYSVDEVFSLNVVPPTCEGGSVFYSGTKENGTLHVPAESIAAYMQAYVWKDFFNILPIGDFDPGLDKDEEGNYLIASADDWRAFANLTIIEPSANAKMTADIDLGDDQTTVGTQDVPYAGMFDGNGHTLTVAYSQNIHGLAPFRYINGATIQRIHITGTIDTQTGKNAAGIVSYSTGGTTTISECWSSAKLKGDDTMGGICAVIQDGTMNINDCLVDGTISGSNAYNGGFISHPDNTATVNINNGLFLRYAVADVYWSGTFFRSDQDWFGPRNLYNCYYFYPYGYPQGIQATEEELTDGTLAVALQDGREEQIWGQNTDLNHPVPVVFLTHVAHSTEYETSCDYFDWHGQRYTTSGTYTYEEKNAQGEVTDIYTLELTIHYSTTSSLNMDLYVGDHYATDMYDFTVEKDGETTYYYTTTNAAGCDSVIVLGITILEPQTYETNATINEGESYEWRGNTYTEAGTYTDEVLTEYGGVKEIYILNLTVKEPDPIHYTFDANGHDYVDLGLPTGTLWATCNIGATVPEGMGDFFAWGETEPKDGVYGWTTYKYCNGTQTTQTKYCIDSNYGTVDGKTVLEPEDDAAAVSWGGTWRMPTIEEIQELLDNTTWQETTVNGVRGMKFTSKENDSYIFFPFSGYRDEGNHFGYGERGFYWSNKLLDPNGGGGRLYMWPTNGGVKIYSAGRCHGLSVRGVLGALAQDEEGYYQIASANDWKLFAKLVGTETVVNARMTADIDLGDGQTMVGTVEHPYQGTFDGQGHTLTVNLNSYYTFDIGAVAPFACVKDATIKKLHVAGSLKQQYCAAGGVVGNIQGNLTVSQCWVSAYLYVQGFSNNQGTIGGIASYCDDPAVTDCEIVIEDCIFSGEFGTGIHSGSMMSHVNGGYGNHATLRNCLNIGTFPSASGSSGTFIRPIQGDSFEIDNCFYMNSFGYTQGTHATEEQLANGTTARALQAGRSEQVWVQDLGLGQPMLMVFSKNPDPDGIEEIESLTPALSKGEGAVYDLCGRKLSAGPSTPGLYIVGGKKVMVK